MATRGAPLSQLVRMVKGEIGFNQSVGTASDNEIKTLLADKQQWLASDNDWPYLESRYTVNINPGNRYINVPAVNFERPVLVEVKWTAQWQDVDYGIGSPEFNYLDSDIGQAQDPVLRWNMAGMLEVEAPTVAPTGAVSGTGLTGVYQWGYTYTNPFGETTISPVLAHTLANQGFNVSVTAGPSGIIEEILYPEITGINLYRTKAGGTDFFLVHSFVGNANASFVDNVADSLLVTSAPTYSTAEATVFEVWPIPVSSQQVRFTGQRNLNPLILDNDTADLDSMMLVYFVAGEMLVRRKQADGEIKLKLASDRKAFVKQSYPRRTRDIVLGGARDKTYNKIVPMRIVAAAGGQ